ncbi:MAG: hypothetical protein OXM61_18490 [Candidatus Poribacteria bacterium]|nr:hypothetical protein [Candidatus Poribacteria bacterium]
MSNPKSIAQIGMTYLKEAILEVLFYEPNLRQHEISKRLGIRRTGGATAYEIIEGILTILIDDEERVVRGGSQEVPRFDLSKTERSDRSTCIGRDITPL